MAKAAPLSKGDRLRLEAKVADAEEALAAAKPERQVCETCGQRIPLTREQRAAIKKAAADVHKVRDPLRRAREQADAP
jgi:hypothetical protein